MPACPVAWHYPLEDSMAERSTRAIVACGRWLAECLKLGWSRDQLDALEALWWEHHDEHGNPRTPGVKGDERG
jgi:hypothetical protein